jgi:hypothetical protein
MRRTPSAAPGGPLAAAAAAAAAAASGDVSSPAPRAGSGGAGGPGGAPFISPPPTVTSGTISSGEDGAVRLHILGDGPVQTPAKAGEGELRGTTPAASSSSPPAGHPDIGPASDAQPAHTASGSGSSSGGSGGSMGGADGTPTYVGVDSDESTPPPASAAPSSSSQPFVGGKGTSTSAAASAAARSLSAADQDDAGSVGGVSIGEGETLGPLGGAGGRRRSMDEVSDEGSFASLTETSFAGRIRSMASGLIGSVSVPPTTAGAIAAANMTTEERIAAMRQAAAMAVQAADEAYTECVEAWIAHAKAKEAFHKQLVASVVIFNEIEKKRVAELSDSLRRYAVFISSLHANLQYDVQRLSAKVESVVDAPATTLTALAASKRTIELPPTPSIPVLPDSARRTSVLELGLSARVSLGGGGRERPGPDVQQPLRRARGRRL